MEKLWQLRRERDYPLIVLDTPPTTHALEFLEAPNRVLDFLGNDAARVLLTPALAAGKFGLSFFKKGGLIGKSLSRFTGTELLSELANFMLVLGGLQNSFRARARQVQELLADEGTAFVLVTGPSPERMDEAVQFHEVLRSRGHRVAAVVVNRCHWVPPAEIPAELARLAPALADKVEKTRQEQRALAERDRAGIEALQEAVAPTPLAQVPQMSADVHDLGGLGETARYLTDEQPR